MNVPAAQAAGTTSSGNEGAARSGARTRPLSGAYPTPRLACDSIPPEIVRASNPFWSRTRVA